MAGRQKLDLWNHLVVGAAMVALLFLLAPRWGAWGAALAMFTSMVLINILKLLELRVCLGLRPLGPRWHRPLFAAGCFLAVLAVARSRYPGAGGVAEMLAPPALGLAVYIGVLRLWRDEREAAVWRILKCESLSLWRRTLRAAT
jgi:O-antigen/teichoic acid export membrane protein